MNQAYFKCIGNIRKFRIYFEVFLTTFEFYLLRFNKIFIEFNVRLKIKIFLFLFLFSI